MPSKKRTARKQNAFGGTDVRPQRTISGRVIPAVHNPEQVRVMRVPITSMLYMVLIAYCMLDAGVPRIWHARQRSTRGAKPVTSSPQETDTRDGKKGSSEITCHVDSGCTGGDISNRRGSELVSCTCRHFTIRCTC